MRLYELTFIGDDGGIGRELDTAFKNLEHHSKTHPDKHVKQACQTAMDALRVHMNHPSSIYEDPHTALALIRQLQEKPDVTKLRAVTDALRTYQQTD